MRLNVPMRDGDSLIVGQLVGVNKFFIYVQENGRTTAYNASHMVSIRRKAIVLQRKPEVGGRQFASAEEDGVVLNSQNDIERQKDANRKRREELMKRRQEQVSGKKFT